MKQGKGFFAGFCAALALSCLVSTAGASVGKVRQEIEYRDIQVTLDGRTLDLRNAKGETVEPFLFGGTNYLPVRALAEALGLRVAWDGARNTVRLTTPSPVTESRVEEVLARVDRMEGLDFEYWSAALLRRMGYTGVDVTPASGDQGVDVLAEKEGVTFAVQCKRYSADLGNAPVQEVAAGRAHYRRHVGAVMTNRYFTAGARALAASNGVLLWDRDWLAAALKTLEDAGTDITFAGERPAGGSEAPSPSGQEKEDYVLNTKTMKIHTPGCPAAAKIAPGNAQKTALSIQDLLAQGYTLCGQREEPWN